MEDGEALILMLLFDLDALGVDGMDEKAADRSESVKSTEESVEVLLWVWRLPEEVMDGLKRSSQSSSFSES